MSAPGKSRAVALARRVRAGALLRLGPGPLSVAYARPSYGVHAAGLGVAMEGLGEVSWLDGHAPERLPGPFFGGWAFDPDRGWAGFPAERWVLPEVLGCWDGTQTWLCAFGAEGTSAGALAARLDAVEEVDPVTVPLTSRRRSPRDGDAYAGLVRGALEAIRAGAAEKLVVAREVVVECEGEIAERSVLKALEARHQDCLSFLLRGTDGRAFVGATPELLCEVRGSHLGTEALAGTAGPGEGRALLASEKDRREHAAVVQGIRAALAPFSEEVSGPGEPVLRELPHLVHLWTPLEARLRAGVGDFEVARALHPTPATAGAPRTEALRWLAANEGFSRGWYGGAFGAWGPAGLTLHVGLRSALLEGRTARVFAGAGIVAGSTPEREWDETERKAHTWLDVLGVPRG